MELENNPFVDSGIANYEQYKKYQYLEFGNVANLISPRIKSQISQIQNGYFFGERLIIIAERGAGKTSTLFHLHDILKEAKIKSYIFSRLVESIEDIMEGIRTQVTTAEKMDLEKQTFATLTNKPVYLLFDFPDMVETTTFRKFMSLLWTLLTHKNYDKINLIFAMNASHYDKSYSIGETFGKFTPMRLERLSETETNELIQSRLDGKKLEEFFSPPSLEYVFKITKGIPRNVISACCVLYSGFRGYPIPLDIVEKIFKDKIYEQIIKDRVEDLQLRTEYYQIIDIIKNDFGGIVESKIKLSEKVREKTGIGMNTTRKRLDELINFGVFNSKRGGYNRLNQILSLE